MSIWLLVEVVVGVGMVVCALWAYYCRKRPVQPSAAELSLAAERDAGLVFNGIFLMPGYYKYEKHDPLGFTCRNCGGANWSHTKVVGGGRIRWEQQCASCLGPNIDWLGDWLVRLPEDRGTWAMTSTNQPVKPQEFAWAAGILS